INIIYSIFHGIIVLIIFIIWIIKKIDKPKEMGNLEGQFSEKRDKNSDYIQIEKKWIMPTLWIVTVLFGLFSIFSYPVLNSNDIYKFITLFSLILFVNWNVINIGYYKPRHSRPLPKIFDAFKFVFIAELPTMCSLGSVIVGTIMIDNLNSFYLFVYTFTIAITFVGITVLIERLILNPKYK
ncbi:hypothetical protein, partial [Lysinibacillus sp. NPDC056185]|uniref:hypothetical protein n=1 Tax=Lysinibacillus sp. NPDC056185 TaxID=3345739 RepID=UPI0039F05513